MLRKRFEGQSAVDVQAKIRPPQTQRQTALGCQKEAQPDEEKRHHKEGRLLGFAVGSRRGTAGQPSVEQEDLMEHAKKLMLVDPANFDVRNVKRHYTFLDQSISDVLDRRDVDARTKLQLYQAAVNKFLLNKQNVENELKGPVKVELSEPSGHAAVGEAASSVAAAQTPQRNPSAVAQELEADEEDIKPLSSSSETTKPSRRKGIVKSSASIKKGVFLKTVRKSNVGKERVGRSSLPPPPRRSSRKAQEKNVLPWLFYR